MSITVLNYLDQKLVDNITQQASMRASTTAATTESSDFAASLSESSKALASNNNSNNSTNNTTNSSTTVSSPADYETFFQEASDSYGVSTTLLKSIARAESNFNPSAVSSAGAIGIMQLMPATAAALGVSNSYDARENIMGGAKYISQLLSKYEGNISLALAAYNAGSNNVDKYGGIPPFTETQNYVQKVLSYMNGSFSTESSSNTTASYSSGIFGLTGEERDAANEMLGKFFAANNITKSTLDMFVHLLKNLSSVVGNTSTGTNSSTANTSVATSDVYPAASTSAPVLPETSAVAITGTAIPAPAIPTVDPVVTEDDSSTDETISSDEESAMDTPITPDSNAEENSIEENPIEESTIEESTIEESTIGESTIGENNATDTSSNSTGDAIAAPSI